MRRVAHAFPVQAMSLPGERDETGGIEPQRLLIRKDAMMRTVICLPALAGLAALGLVPAPAFAQESRTKTFDGPNATVTQTTTLDREAGTLERDRTATAKESGKTVSTSLDRQRTETGSTVARSRTGPEGATRSFEGERVRGEMGSTFAGTATTRTGEQYGVSASRSRDGAGNSQASQRITGPEGQTLYGRDRTTTRSRTESGGIRTEHNVSRTRDPEFRPRRGAGGQRQRPPQRGGRPRR
ncbi:hypothetical protein SAMN04515621_0302 [Erythrobacter sp. HL-111]|nr:MAG: hypothetical protein HLUCCO15_01280 [Erythrobacteraceae bacterium HL-111]SDR76416.1 hypothetical protein SAMN04515621_0302 [Erythrobacter sp. HL-111]